MPLHVKDVNVENDRLHGLVHAVPKTQDENEDFKSQDNLNDSQDLVTNNHDNNHGTRNAAFINLFH
jgi:hypothetical protein